MMKWTEPIWEIPKKKEKHTRDQEMNHTDRWDQEQPAPDKKEEEGRVEEKLEPHLDMTK